MNKYPFDFDPKQSFISQASDWIADVFYEKLPEAGFEIRDEQIYMAFQLERAYADKQTIFAEAGVGTGKTFVYLLYAITYARYTRKPAIIACADESLIEQLVKPEGDIAKLARYLDLTIDARLGKSADQYICLKKLDQARSGQDDAELFDSIYRELPSFVHKQDSMQSFHPYGNRKEYPNLNDEQWNQLGWDVFQDCLVCDVRHRCGQTLSRDHYRKAADVVICSHDFYMEHVWTYEARKREGQLPLLPEHSSVVFDEGHLLETAAQQALTYKLNHAVFEGIVTRLLQEEIRESLAVAVEDAITQSEFLFKMMNKHSRKVQASDRREIIWSTELIREINRLQDTLSVIEEELVFESGLYTIDTYQLKIVEEHLEMIQFALSLFKKEDKPISWVSEDKEGTSLVIMPKWVKEVLKEQVFSRKMPIVFSSATLSVNGSFDYMMDILGMDSAISFSVPSPYDYEQQMTVATPDMGLFPSINEKMAETFRLLTKSGGRSLLLFPSMEQLEQFKTEAAKHAAAASFTFYYEGSSEISYLIEQFQHDEASILCAVTLWEGLDIPGPSLSQVIVWELPFPPNDPLFAARRNDAEQPFEQVDMPYMLLRLRQGIGRLIRRREDSGSIIIFGEKMNESYVREQVEQILPKGVALSH
ncbi:ATP-dependent DNA helicase DinG [Paenibacillus endophyticus]|uniref:ATP-dependent DNA helicase DinG n=1 Tax=Paenibacillus endophyticus TaxID=1294268 RepID=A0A7W5C5L7_9BACL|nr:ATP-dependent DNA helicase [Paenibacillus endophyticus]MBB3151580.1 ATP-dependent DNA helicase DinG [Paenibacillus endophyticus]